MYFRYINIYNIRVQIDIYIFNCARSLPAAGLALVRTLPCGRLLSLCCRSMEERSRDWLEEVTGV